MSTLRQRPDSGRLEAVSEKVARRSLQQRERPGKGRVIVCRACCPSISTPRHQASVVTTIIVRHKTSDFLRLGLHVALRRPTLRWMTLALAAAVFATNVYQTKEPWEPFTLIGIILTTVLFVFVYFLLMVGLTVLSALLRNRKGSPASEAQTYALTDFGLSRQSASSETLLKWGGARILRRNRNAIYVATSATSYMILPRHSFASDGEYETVWNAMQRLAPAGGPGEGQKAA